MLAFTHSAPQPLRVAGPRQITPWSSRHSSILGSISKTRKKRFSRFSLRGRPHSSQQVFSPAPSTAPRGGNCAPDMMAPSTATICFGWGGQPGIE
jgi:hypothetical protein